MDWTLLQHVSRSMYLSLRVLPEPVRPGMGLGYLLCRAADTIADTRVVPNAERRQVLEEFRAAFDGQWVPALSPTAALAEHQASDAERELLGRLGECLGLWAARPEAERILLKEVVHSVIDGMRLDLLKEEALGLGPGGPQGQALAQPSQKLALGVAGLVLGQGGRRREGGHPLAVEGGAELF